jgi:hypothetical protein
VRISVVVPVYNEEGFVGACLETVLAQPDPWATLRRDRGRKNPMLPLR